MSEQLAGVLAGGRGRGAAPEHADQLLDPRLARHPLDPRHGAPPGALLAHHEVRGGAAGHLRAGG